MYTKRVLPWVFTISLNSNTKYSVCLTEYKDDELSLLSLYKDKKSNMWYALKDAWHYTDIVSVHNNSWIKGKGKALMLSAIRRAKALWKEVRLDCFDWYLSNFYKSLGFKEIWRDKYNSQYDLNWELAKQFGEVDVVYYAM